VKGWQAREENTLSCGGNRTPKIVEEQEWDGNSFTAFEVGPRDLHPASINVMK
jgi:hypothetical protein